MERLDLAALLGRLDREGRATLLAQLDDREWARVEQALEGLGEQLAAEVAALALAGR